MQRVPHFTGKARVWEHVLSLGFPVCVSLEAGWYNSNLVSFPLIVGFAKQDDASTVAMTATMLDLEHKLPGYDASSTGEGGCTMVTLLSRPARPSAGAQARQWQPSCGTPSASMASA